MKKVILLIIALMLLGADAFCASKKKKEEETKEEEPQKTVITIMNALKSGNKKDEKNGDDLLTFEGNVQISVEKGGTKSVISADKVSYNRAREMLFAEGAVKLEQTEASGASQTISADSLLLNTQTLEGVFDNSRVVKAESNAINLPSGSKITVASDLFARDDSGAISFKNGSLTFCDEEENPHWRIKASRIWLLPGNEFAFLNALVYVGPVPVMYLPAFYYPKDELIFNPVFGYRNRAGYFFQTTTYLFGRKPLDTSSSSDKEDKGDDILGDYFSLIKPTKLMDQKREGLIMHNLDTEYKGDTSNYLKVLLDYYTNLGISTGLAGAYKGADKIPAIEASAILGFSNTVFLDKQSSYWHPFGNSGTTYKDESDFMGFHLPFRYKGNFKVNGSFPFSYSLSIPIYSDPFFDYDFGKRSETMDWFSYLLNNPNIENSTKTEDEKREAAEISSFNWETNASYTIPLPEIIKPFVNSLSISTFNSSISFSEAAAIFSNLTPKEISDGWSTFTPSRKFFYPSTVTPLRTGLKISGTIFSTSITRSRTKKTDKTLAMDLAAPAFDEEEGAEKKEDAQTEEKQTEETQDEVLYPDSVLPDLAFSLPSQSSFTPFSYSLDYSISPDFSSQLTYASEPLATSKDFDFNNPKASYFQVKSPVTLNSNLSFYDSFFS
ncbi:MAG: LPS-assembly protein LptD, partial [Treponema sp.]|nr:LPS-assembly protein LptD [Treponema sp.]